MKFSFFEMDESYYDFGIITYIRGSYKSFSLEILGCRVFQVSYKKK
jgi:hypothetical protein